jgi:integrase
MTTTTEAATGKAKKKDTFVHGGKTYRLRFRKGSPFYNLRFERRGEVITHSLKTDIKHIAVAKAVTFLKALDDAERTGITDGVDRLRTKSDYCTIEEIAQAWKAAIPTLRIAKRTAMDYIGQLEGLLRVSTGRDEVGSLRSNILTKETVDAFVENARKAGRPDHSIASQIVHARAVFKKSRMDIYKDLKLPDLTMFRGCSYEFAPNQQTGHDKFTTQELLDLHAASERLYQERSPLWVAYILMFSFGLRNNMAYELKWSDFTIDESEVRFIVRGNYIEAKAVSHRVPQDIWERLQTYRQNGSEYVIPAKHNSARHDMCYRDICRFIEQYVKRDGERKKAYLLRRQFGTVKCETEGVYAAQRGLGHRSVTTTEKYYGPREFSSDGLGMDAIRTGGRQA